MKTRATVKGLRLAAAAMGALLIASPATASMITIFDGTGTGELRSDWEAAIGVFAMDIFLENYNDQDSDGFDIMFLGTSHDGGPADAGILGAVHDRITATNSTVLEFDVPIFGFGADWNLADIFGPGFGLTVTFGGMLVGEIPNTHAGQFWGFVSDMAFSTLVLTAGTQDDPDPGLPVAETYYHDDAAYAPVPEPSAAMTFGVGLIVAGMGIRRRSR